MYVKLFNRILDSSLADNRALRHFFIDLLLCSDPDGNVIMTKAAIGKRIGASPEEVEWGITELQKTDGESLTPDHDGRRIIPLEGHGYGWKIINYAMYRDFKTAGQLRAATAERVQRFRERKKNQNPVKYSRNPSGSGWTAAFLAMYTKAYEENNEAEMDRVIELANTGCRVTVPSDSPSKQIDLRP